jgi:pyridoxal phosphate enzyme (YggS family)
MPISENFDAVFKKIRRAERMAGREEGRAHLVAVTKTQSLESLKQTLDYGHRLFGENKVQEAKDHWEDFKKEYPDIKLHLIGPLQTNKAKDAVALFDCIETLDREKLAGALADEMKKQGRDIPCFIQVNTGEEEQKAGVLPSGLENLLHYARGRGLTVTGLMCIPPADEPAALHFAFLKKLASRHNLPCLSMGMSADFEKAIALGATHVRIGTALFGERVSV